MRSMILQAAGPYLAVLVAVFSVLMLLRGHLEPGGGFVGGLLLASAFILRSLTDEPRTAREVLWVEPRTLIAAGLLLAAIAALAGPLLEREILAPVWFGTFPVLEHVGTTTLFDVGVYLLVAGAALHIVLTIAEEEE